MTWPSWQFTGVAEIRGADRSLVVVNGRGGRVCGRGDVGECGDAPVSRFFFGCAGSWWWEFGAAARMDDNGRVRVVYV